MKKNVHPQYYTDTKVTCACGNTFTTGSTVKEIRVELCSQCHPFYTGKLRIVATENLVRKFEAKKKAAKLADIMSKKEKREKRRSKVSEIRAEKKLTLKDMLKDFNK